MASSDDSDRNRTQNRSDADLLEALRHFADTQVSSLIRAFVGIPTEGSTSYGRTTETYKNDSMTVKGQDRQCWDPAGSRESNREPSQLDSEKTSGEVRNSAERQEPSVFLKSLLLPVFPLIFDNLTTDMVPESASLFSIQYVFFSPYSPLYFERTLPRTLTSKQFGASWMRDAYMDLLKSDLAVHTELGSNHSEEQNTSSDAISSISDSSLTSKEGRSSKPNGQPDTELDLYSYFFPNQTAHDRAHDPLTSPFKGLSKDILASDTRNSSADNEVSSIVRSVERTTSADGVTYTKIVTKKTFKDGRQISEESEISDWPEKQQNASLPLQSRRSSEAVNASKENRAKSTKLEEKPKGGWFWS